MTQFLIEAFIIFIVLLVLLILLGHYTDPDRHE